MCLGIPVKVVEVLDSGMGRVDFKDTKIKANLMLVEDVKVGDWVIIHAGYAISKLNESEAQETLDLLRDILQDEQQTEG